MRGRRACSQPCMVCSGAAAGGLVAAGRRAMPSASCSTRLGGGPLKLVGGVHISVALLVGRK